MPYYPPGRTIQICQKSLPKSSKAPTSKSKRTAKGSQCPHGASPTVLRGLRDYFVLHSRLLSISASTPVRLMASSWRSCSTTPLNSSSLSCRGVSTTVGFLTTGGIAKPPEYVGSPITGSWYLVVNGET